MFIPSVTLVEQAGIKFLRPSISTMQTRHVPTLFTILMSCKSKWHSVGMCTPKLRAASNMVVPSGTLVLALFMLILINRTAPYPFMIALRGHLCKHTPHLMHFDWSIT